jgi:ATP adenylyltransferase
VDTIFTPWRYSYLTAPKQDTGNVQCIFCAATETDPARSLTLFSDDTAVIMLNRYPYTNGHLMVAPRQHLAALDQSPDHLLLTIMKLAAHSQRILSDTYHPDGFNIGMNLGVAAGAGVADHYHLHVVPRWSGDSNFMSVTARTRLIPEELDTTFERLRPQFASFRSH